MTAECNLYREFPGGSERRRRNRARVSEERSRRDRLLAVTELHLFGPPSRKVIFFQGGNFLTPTVTASCRKRAALCPRLLIPLSPAFHLGISLCPLSSSWREYKHFAAAGRQKFGLNCATGAGQGELGRKKDRWIYFSSASRVPR